MMRSLMLSKARELTCLIPIFLLAFFVCAVVMSGQVLAEEGDLIWFKSYNLEEEGDNTSGHDVAQTPDGGYILAGESSNSETGDGISDALLLKTDSNGDTLWTRLYSFHQDVNCLGYFVFITDDGGYLLFGQNVWIGPEIPPGMPIGIFALRTNDVGDSLGATIYNMELDNITYVAYDICRTADGGYAIFGNINDVDGGDYRGFMMKLDSDLRQMWSQVYEPNHSGNYIDNLYIHSGRQTPDGGYILAGKDQILEEDAWQDSIFSYLIKTDTLGNVLWERRVNGTDDRFECIYQTPDGGYICGGSDGDYGHEQVSSSDFTVTKTDASGDEEWVIHSFYNYPDDTLGTCTSVCPIPGTDNNEYLACGMKQYYFGPNQDHCFYSPKLMRIDSDGNIIWNRCYGEQSGEERGMTLRSMIVTAQGDYIIAGHTPTVSYGEYVTARPKAFLALIEGTPTGIDDDNNLPSEPALTQNYPNPFNMSTVISYELNHDTQVKLEIYDILGRQVATLVDEDQSAGTHAITWNARDIVSGIYFYKMQTADFSETRRMLFIK